MMATNEIFHEHMVTRIVEACERLCRGDAQVFKPALIKELGLDPDSQETSGMISLIFQLNLVSGYRLVKGKNGGIKRISAETKAEVNTNRKCKKCGESGHNSRTCQKEVEAEENSSPDNEINDTNPENNNDPEWLLDKSNNDAAVGE